MYFARRLVYYFKSLFTLIHGVRNWPALFRLIRPGKVPVILVLRNGTRYLARNLMDAWTIKETNLDRHYEVYGTPIQDRWIIVDIGAAMGDFAIFAARRAPHGRVFAYEPAPDSLALLERNLQLNSVGNVAMHPVAVSREAGVMSLDTSGGVAVQYRTVGSSGRTIATVQVPSVALADVLAGLPGGVCDFLKMDCEGAEYDMLLHLDEVSLKRIRRICLEYHEFVTPYSHTDLEEHFLSRGWNVRVGPSRVRRELGFLYAVAPTV